ncbi:hypothetical protein BLA13014_07596 [Burkholderia aenigmatica]|uniref:Uncharacterized protein n=1 Tax=Burkholderia aenigmatica TaxID=2015348 RepID=A0A6P2T0L0_9BURK|nr:hypothetical protein [Burkholderia aenigmatica]VWC49459.1 hypothetical protein BLA13014_07596 [Burkholderia aenigmatica]
MKKTMLLLALASLTGMSHAEEICVVKNIRLPVVEVNDLHQEMDLPQTATTCTGGKCESRVVKSDHFVTEPRFEIVLAYKGDTVSYEASEAPKGKTVAAQVRECGKKHTPRAVKPAV